MLFSLFDKKMICDSCFVYAWFLLLWCFVCGPKENNFNTPFPLPEGQVEIVYAYRDSKYKNVRYLN